MACSKVYLIPLGRFQMIAAVDCQCIIPTSHAISSDSTGTSIDCPSQDKIRIRPHHRLLKTMNVLVPRKQKKLIPFHTAPQ